MRPPALVPTAGKRHAENRRPPQAPARYPAIADEQGHRGHKKPTETGHDVQAAVEGEEGIHGGGRRYG